MMLLVSRRSNLTRLIHIFIYTVLLSVWYVGHMSMSWCTVSEFASQLGHEEKSAFLILARLWVRGGVRCGAE